MEYRRIGRTEMQASVVGLGAEHLDRKPYELVRETVHEALEQGMNIMDLFMPGEEIRRHIGKALAGNRDKFLIQGHIGSVDLNQQYDISRDLAVCKRYFEGLLRDLGTDYIDFGMLFYLDTQEDFDKVFSDILPYVEGLKKQGTVRSIGASSHNPAIARQAVESGVIDVLLFSLNPAFDMTPAKTDVLTTLEKDFEGQVYRGMDPQRMELYQLCEQRGVGITVMKTLGAGKLLSADHTPFAKPMTAGQCIHYALTRPAVVSALVGCASAKEVREAARYLELSPEERDYTGVVASFRETFQGKCVYCSHCLPCPSEIDIASVNKYLDIAVLDEANVPPSIRQHYASLKAHGSDCISCGSCEARCPFGVLVIENMGRAAALFGR